MGLQFACNGCSMLSILLGRNGQCTQPRRPNFWCPATLWRQRDGSREHSRFWAPSFSNCVCEASPKMEVMHEIPKGFPKITKNWKHHKISQNKVKNKTHGPSVCNANAVLLLHHTGQTACSPKCWLIRSGNVGDFFSGHPGCTKVGTEDLSANGLALPSPIRRIPYM